MSVNTPAVLTCQVSQIPQEFMCYTAEQLPWLLTSWMDIDNRVYVGSLHKTTRVGDHLTTVILQI